MLGAEHHGLGIALLPRFAIDREPQVQILRVWNLIFGHEPWTERTEGFAAFAFRPLPGAFDLKHTLGHVIGGAIARYRVEPLALLEIARALTDNDAEFDLVIQFAGILRRDGVVVRSADAGARLVEDHRLLRQLHAGFGGVI